MGCRCIGANASTNGTEEGREEPAIVAHLDLFEGLANTIRHVIRLVSRGVDPAMGALGVSKI